MVRSLTLIIFIAILFGGCTRDDLCPQGTATTPNIILRFKDINNPEVLKSVIGLSVETDYDSPVLLIPRIDTDSISLPLNINSDTTRYRFIQTKIEDTDTIFVKVDKVEFIYQRQEDYVNRACGFKMIFNDVSASKQNEPPYESWIQNIDILRDTVNDETKAHISILH